MQSMKHFYWDVFSVRAAASAGFFWEGKIFDLISRRTRDLWREFAVWDEVI